MGHIVAHIKVEKTLEIKNRKKTKRLENNV